MPSAKPSTTLPAFTPVPRKCNRHDGWTPERQQLFMEALADYGSVRAAANSVGMTPESAYLLRRHPEAQSFRKAWEAALDLGMKRVEDVAMDRALNGVDVPVYSYGKLVGTRTTYNDRLLMFMLRNRAPKRFAADGAKGLSALDKSTLSRMKKQWRKEWEKEQGALRLEEEVATIESINAKIDAMREKAELYESPRVKEARKEFDRICAEERDYEWWKDPDHPLCLPRYKIGAPHAPVDADGTVADGADAGDAGDAEPGEAGPDGTEPDGAEPAGYLSFGWSPADEDGADEDVGYANAEDADEADTDSPDETSTPQAPWHTPAPTRAASQGPRVRRIKDSDWD